MSDNAAQIEQWNGRLGQTWLRYADVLDRVLAPLGNTAMDRADLRSAQRVLDIGCGPGDTTLALARRVGPTGHVLGVDISAPLLTLARERAAKATPAERAPVDFRESDASEAALPSDRDHVFSRFGVMFFADPPRAFAHLRGALVPRGRLTFVCWRKLVDNPWAKVGADAVATIVPPTPPVPGAPGPFAFADRAHVENILETAGYRDIDVAPHDAVLRWTERGDLEEALDLFSHTGPAARALVEMNDADRARAIDALRTAIAPHVRADGLHLTAGVWIVSARA
jgi:SAM-dependent methyltransferase